MDKQKIKETFNWNDENIYKWIIKPPKNAKMSFFVLLIFFIFVPTIIYGILYLIGLLSQKVAFYIAFVLFIIWLGFIVSNLLAIFFGKETDKSKGRAYLRSQSFVFIAFLFFTISSPASFWAKSFVTDSYINKFTLSEWLMYFIDNILSVICIDALEIFDLNLSAIRPITWGAKAMMFLFNLVLTIGIIDAVADIYSRSKDEEFFGTLQDFYYRCDELQPKHQYEILIDGKFAKLDDTVSFNAKDFIDAFLDEANVGLQEK